MNKFIGCRNLLFAVTSFFVLFAHVVKADIEQIKALDFGEIAIIDNTVASQLIIDYLGNINTDSGIRVIRPGEPGEYEASGFAGNVQLFISTSVVSSVMNPGQVSGEYPNLVALDAPASVRTDTDGTATIFVGGTIETSSSGSLNFIDATYSSNIQIIINF